MAAAVVGFKVTQKRKERWQQGVEALTSAVRGTPTWPVVSEIIDWLNSYWAGPYDTEHLMASTSAVGITTTIQGYPTLLFIDPQRPAKWLLPKTHMFPAAWIPGVSDGADPEPPRTEEVTRCEQELRSQGFVVELNQGGLLAIADEDLVTLIREQPESMLELAGALVDLARLGRCLGAAPAPRIAQ